MTDENLRIDTIRERAKACAERHGVQLPSWSVADDWNKYIGKCANLFRDFSPDLKNTDLTRVGDFGITSRLASQVFDAADKARPRGNPDGSLRYVTDRSTGREILRAYADADDACWRQFTNQSVVVGKFNRPSASSLAATERASKRWWQP
jgi:hypothetical protein